MALPINEVVDVVRAGLSLAEALHDGIDLGDISVVLKLPAAISGIDQVPAQLADMDEAEKEELKAVVREFDLPDDELENAIEHAVNALVEIYHVFLLFKKREASGS